MVSQHGITTRAYWSRRCGAMSDVVSQLLEQHLRITFGAQYQRMWRLLQTYRVLANKVVLTA